MSEPILTPGWKTTEFWVTLVTQIVGIVSLFRPVAVSDQMVNTIASVAVMIATLVAYIMSRKAVKVATLNQVSTTTTTTVADSGEGLKTTSVTQPTNIIK
jgi:hypothetical protein